jgi:hypothetical protein
MTEAEAKALAAKTTASKPTGLEKIIKANESYNLGPKPNMMSDLIEKEKAMNTPKFTAGPTVPEKKKPSIPANLVTGTPITDMQRLAASMDSTGASNVGDLGDKPKEKTALQKVADSMGPGYSNVGDLGDKPTTRSSLTNFEAQDKTPVVEAEAAAVETAPEERGLIGQTDSAINNSAIPETKTGIGSKISELVKKYGVGLADIIQAGAQGYTGNNAETSLDKRNAEAQKERENAYFAKLSEEKDRLDAKRQADAEARQFAYLTERDKSQSLLDAEGLDKQLENNITLAKLRGDIPTVAAPVVKDWSADLMSRFGGE